MKKDLSKKVLAKEADFWKKLAVAAKDNRGKICHK